MFDDTHSVMRENFNEVILDVVFQATCTRKILDGLSVMEAYLSCLQRRREICDYFGKSQLPGCY